nr:G8 domain-containing protein [Treponema sp.]
MRKFAFLFILLFAIFSAFSQTTYSTIASSSTLDWNSASSWEDIDGNGTGDIPVISGDDSVGDVTINLNAPVEYSDPLTFNDSGSKTITINTNGNNFTSSAAWIFVAVTGSGVSKNANVSVTGGGTVSVDTLDFPESGSHSLTVDSGSTFRIEKKFYGNANSTIMTFTGSGTLYIPASGADLNFGNSGILYDSSLEVLPVGDPSYYKISSDGSSIHSANGIGITFSVDRTGDSGATSAVPFTYTAVSEGSASLSDFTFLGAELSSTGSLTVTGNDLTRHLRYAPSDPSKTLAAGDGVTLTFSTPDLSMILAQISWVEEEPHWIGITSTDWNTATNWSNGAVPSGTDNVVISSGCPRYPEIDAEVEAASVVVNTNARFTVVSGGKLTASSVTCNGNSRIELPGGTLASSSFTMNDYGYIHATGSGLTGGTVEFTGNSTWNPNYPDRTTFYNVTVDSGADLTANCALNIDGNIEIKSGAQLTSGGDITINGNWLNNGTFVPGSYDVIFSGSALQEITGGSSGFSGFKITGSKVKIIDDFEVTGTAVLSCDIDESSTGILSFGGNVTASSGITIGCDFDFASSGSRSFTAPAGNLYITGNADFSLCQSLTHSSGTVHLDSIASKSFTGGSTLGFNVISISGNVTLKGNVAADSITTVAGAEPAIEGSVDISSAFTVVKDSVLYIKQGGNVLSSGSGQLVLNSGTLNYTGSSAYSLALPVFLSMNGTTPVSLVSSSAELTLPDVTYSSNPNISVTGDVTLAGGSVGKLTIESASTLTCSDSFTVEGLATLYGDVNCTDSLTFNGGIKSMDDSAVIEGTAVITSGSANTEISGEDLKINCNWTNSGSGTLTVSNAL